METKNISWASWNGFYACNRRQRHSDYTDNDKTARRAAHSHCQSTHWVRSDPIRSGPVRSASSHYVFPGDECACQNARWSIEQLATRTRSKNIRADDRPIPDASAVLWSYVVVVGGVFCPKAGSFSLTLSFSVMCLFFQLCVINRTLFIFLHQCIQ